ncbi:MAG TPA: hypothetical protein DDW90_00600 [Cyanobacteria bacterium UBA9971]|nr:hypothetical protein [Cyanobacteria bacterium UBA9971]
MNNTEYNVFISHITEEKEIAFIIKDLINEAFENKINVFVSSDKTSIPLGSKNIDVIIENLSKCSAEIIVCSPDSIKRPWINFEFGAGWLRPISLIPFCHSGIKPDKLPIPFNLRKGICGNDIDDLKILIDHIGDCLKIDFKNKDIDFFQKYTQKIISFESNKFFNTKIIENFQRLIQILEGNKDSVEYDFNSLIKDLTEEEISNIYIPERKGIHIMLLQVMVNFRDLGVIKFECIETGQPSSLGEATSYNIIKGKYFFYALKVFNDYTNANNQTLDSQFNLSPV